MSQDDGPRVLVVSSEYPPGPGGIGTHAHELATGLHRLGWQPAVLTAQHYVSDAERDAFNHAQPFVVETFRRVPTGPLKALDRANTLTRWIARWKPRLVAATGERSTWIAAAALRNSRVPWVAIGHGTEFGVTGWQRTLVRRAFNRAGAVVCVSRFTWEQMRACGIRPKQGLVIPNGADATRFARLSSRDVLRFREERGWRDKRLLLTAGNVTERKGQEVVIRALPRILAREPRACYLMAGLPTERPRLEVLAREIGVAAHVHFLGRVDSGTLVQLMNACDVFAMTSRRTLWGDFEGYGIAVVEAALCGAPAVVSSGSGLSEAIIHGTTGLEAAEGDAEGTAEALLALLMDEPRRKAMGEAARARALAGQTWEHCARRYDALFRELAGVEAPMAMARESRA